MAKYTVEPPGWSASKVAEVDPGLREAAPALFGTLELHALIARFVPGTFPGGRGPEPSYNITELGLRFLDRLSDQTD
jgi:hypothetical protein